MSSPASTSSSSFASNHFKDAESVNSDGGSEGTLCGSDWETCSVDGIDSTSYEFVPKEGTSSENASSSSSHASGVFVRNPDPTPEFPSVQAKLGPIELLNRAPGERIYINANKIPLGEEGQQFLGATVRDNSPTAPKELFTLAKAAQAAKLANKRNGKRNEPAEIVQFISPRAFFNPDASVDKPISQLIRSYKNGLIEGVGTLTKFEERKNSALSAQTQTPPIRSFTVTYLDADAVEQTLVLTEIAPDFRNSLMTAKSIEDTVAQLDGKFSEGMLSWGGVGRVAIMRVALEVKQAIETEPPGSVDDKSIQERVHEAIENLEMYRPKYLSKNLLQREYLINYLQGVATQHIQSAPKPIESTSEQTEVKQKPTLAKPGVQSAPKSVPPPVGQVEVKSDFKKNAETLGFVNTGNSCYMNSALKFLMLTQGEALVTRIEDAAIQLEKDEKFVIKVLKNLHSEEVSLSPSEIEEAGKLVSLKQIMIQDDTYKANKDLKRENEAKLLKPLRNFIIHQINLHGHLPSVDEFTQALRQENLGDTLNPDKDALVGCSARIHQTLWRLKADQRIDPATLTEKLINHVNDLPCYKSQNFDKELGEYEEEFISRSRQELQAALLVQWPTSPGMLDLDQVKSQIDSKLKLIGEYRVQLDLLHSFFTHFKKPIDAATLTRYLRDIRPVFEQICFQGKQGLQQDPAELVEKIQDIFGKKVFFEYAQCSGGMERNNNQIQIHFDQFQDHPIAPVPFERFLTHAPSATDDHSELYAVIRYSDDKQFFKPLNLDHRFELNTSAGKQAFQVDSLVLHIGSQRASGHYIMIHRDKNGTWTKHDDKRVSEHLRTCDLFDSYSVCRPVMIRFKKV